MKPTRMTLFRGAGLALVLLAAPLAADAGSSVNTDAANVAIEGYDAVAYHTVGQPLPGNPAITHEWHDAVWQFASVENRDLFASDPDRYAPQFGGFCAGAMSEGIVAPIDPQEWEIVNGQLFLGGRPGATEYIRNDQQDRLSDANTNWTRLGRSDRAGPAVSEA